MQNTSYCPSCDAQHRVRTIEILGKPVLVKNYICSADGVHYPKKPEHVQLQLSVCPTSYCPGGCPFCIAKDTKSRRRLDLRRFQKTMELLKREDRLRGVKITGGEPFEDVALLNDVITVLYETFGLDLEISLSTNGMRIDQIHRIRHLEYLDAIHISRHHDDDAINRALFAGAPVPDGELLRDVVHSISYRDVFVFNCMLLKGFIDSPKAAHRFLDFAIRTGVPKVGFMTCTPINDYARTHWVAYEDVMRGDDPSLLFTRGYHDYEFCHCTDGVYASPTGELIEFYGRSTNPDGCSYCRGLVYDADNHLRDGFGGQVII